MISFTSFRTADAFEIAILVTLRLDMTAERVAETHRLIRGVDVDEGESVADDFDRGLWKYFRLFQLILALTSRASR